MPVTTVMDTQMDHLVIRAVISPLRKKILTQLRAKILQKRKENWYEIYLTIFILMSNMERQFAQVLLFFDIYGMNVRNFAPLNFTLSFSLKFFNAFHRLTGRSFCSVDLAPAVTRLLVIPSSMHSRPCWPTFTMPAEATYL